ncbi:MAG: protein translocase subunit SecD, partial [Clostridia bacterium]|nr:protein translocase subunit SecD [Clostridia bacterium]
YLCFTIWRFIPVNKKKSIVVLTVVSVFIILMAVFAVVSFPIGNSVYDYTGYVKTVKLGLDMSGGISAVFEVLPDEFGDLDKRVDGTIGSLQSLLVSKGYTESTVTKGTSSNGNATIRVEVPDVDDPERVLDLIGRPASLEFKGENDKNAENLIVGREHLETAYVTTDDTGNYAVGLKFNAKGTEKFAQVTADYLNKSTYIFIDGELYTTVTVNSTITNGSAIITNSGGYTYQAASDFATKLQAGTFGVTLSKTEVRNISATLGENAINTALIAGIVGIALIFIFLIIVYRGLGIAADIALCVYVVLLLWFCAVLPWVQLTLPGIAGILLSIGMAVDANVIIFERIKNEFSHTNKPIPTAIKDGFKRSTAAIIDGNVTTLIGAVVLWILGSSSIVGFAVTLFIGIILSMFTSLVITRLVLKSFLPFNSKSAAFYGLKRRNEEVDTEEESEEASDVGLGNNLAGEEA